MALSYRLAGAGCVGAVLLAGCTAVAQSAPTPTPLGSGPPPSVVAASGSPVAAGPAVSNPRMAYDEAERVVVLFATDGNGNPGTWTWDGSGWTHQRPAATPPAAVGVSLAYDGTDQDVVLFGGAVSGSASAETWTYRSGAWTQQHPATTPPARSNAAMAFDPRSGRVVLFGGCCGGEQFAPSELNDTWAWDGTTWTPLSPGAAPAGREGALLTDEPAMGKLLLFGGSVQGSTTVAPETWTWDGTTWAQLHPAGSPAAGAGPTAMAYHAASQQIVLFIGYTSGGQTWTWNGSAWTLLPIDFAPPAHDHWVAAPFPPSSAVMLYDLVSGGDPGQTWTWDGHAWTRRS